MLHIIDQLKIQMIKKFFLTILLSFLLINNSYSKENFFVEAKKLFKWSNAELGTDYMLNLNEIREIVGWDSLKLPLNYIYYYTYRLISKASNLVK